MCLAKVYLSGVQDPVMEDVTHITVEDNKIQVSTLFGEMRVFEEKIETINFADSRVHLAKTARSC